MCPRNIIGTQSSRKQADSKQKKYVIVQCKEKRPVGLNTKESDVIGRKGDVITVCVMMLNTDAVVGRKVPRKSLKPKTSYAVAITDYSGVYGQYGPLSSQGTFKWNPTNPHGETIFENWIALVTYQDVIKKDTLKNPCFGLPLALGVGVEMVAL